jgi:uncharacterized RDD family membrane protein YckC
MAVSEPTLLASPGTGAPARRVTGGHARTLSGARPRVVVAGFWRRVAAALIDGAIVLPAATLLALLTCHLAGVSRPRGSLAPDRLLDLAIAGEPGLWAPILLVLVMAMIYDGVFLAFQGRTLGMRVLGLRVIDGFGDAPRPPRVLVRLLGQLASLCTLGLGAVWSAIDRDKRALHDHVAGTYVIRGGVERTR